MCTAVITRRVRRLRPRVDQRRRKGWWLEATVKAVETMDNAEVAGPQRALGDRLRDDHIAFVFGAAVTRFEVEAETDQEKGDPVGCGPRRPNELIAQLPGT